MKKIIFILLLISGCGSYEEIKIKTDPWTYSRPSDVGMDENRLLSLDSAIKFGQYENLNSLIVIKDEKIVFESYYNQVDSVSPVWRAPVDIGRSTLALSGISILIAMEKGLIDSLSTPISVLLPEYADIFNARPEKELITIEHLLQHQSGLAWNEGLVSYFSPQNDINIIKAESDWTRYILEKDLEATPGIRYAYNSGSGMIISRIISSLTGMNMESFLQTEIFELMDIKIENWESDPNGITNGFNGATLSLFELSKIGAIFMNDGKWKNRFVIDPIAAGEAISKKVIYGNVIDLGFFWWRFSDNWSPPQVLPINDVFFFPNESGDHIYYVPHQNLIVAVGAENLFYGVFNPSLIAYLEVLRSL